MFQDAELKTAKLNLASGNVGIKGQAARVWIGSGVSGTTLEKKANENKHPGIPKIIPEGFDASDEVDIIDGNVNQPGSIFTT